MENKLKELIGQPNVWLYLQSSKGWIKNVEILDVDREILTFRYEERSHAETKVWEKTTRLDNVLEVDVRLVTIPKCQQQIENMRNKLTEIWELEE